MLNAESVLDSFRRRNFFSGIIMEPIDGTDVLSQLCFCACSVPQTANMEYREHAENPESEPGFVTPWSALKLRAHRKLLTPPVRGVNYSTRAIFEVSIL